MAPKMQRQGFKKENVMESLQWKMPTKVGPVFLVATPKGVCGLYFQKQDVPFATWLKGPDERARHLALAVKELGEYFEGRRQAFTFATDLEGTEFQKKVWGQLARIPYGQTITYPELARRVRQPQAVRAVGAANAQNPLSIVVPCHRVISTSGELRGYSGGLRMKERLLELEGVELE